MVFLLIFNLLFDYWDIKISNLSVFGLSVEKLSYSCFIIFGVFSIPIKFNLNSFYPDIFLFNIFVFFVSIEFVDIDAFDLRGPLKLSYWLFLDIFNLY